MDCNIRCCILVILVALAATCGGTQSSTRCHNLSTLGFTLPSGDIALESGQPLEINCSLYYSTSKLDSKSLIFFAFNKEVSKEYITIIDNTTIRLYIEKTLIQDGMYTCKAKTENGTTAVCLNKVIVGYKPRPVEDFTCVSHNWDNLYCSWIPPHNFIKTNYTASFKYSSVRNQCPIDGYNPNTCFINSTTVPAYRQGILYIKFYLEGANALGTNKWTFNVSHYSVVIPNKPRNLTVQDVKSDSITLHWLIPLGLEHFPPGVIHDVRYKTVYDDDWHQVDTSSLCVRAHKTQCSNDFTLVLPNLKYPNTVYNISVKSRTGKESAHPYKWSEIVYITSRTKATIPASPPLTEIGSFEVVSSNGHGLRNINLFWQDIPKYKKNGNGFHYKIYISENDTIKDIVPQDISRDSAYFPNLTNNNHYKFNIVSVNEIGSSINSSEIIVPAAGEMPLPPEQVTQKPYSKNGVYEVSWVKNSQNSSPVIDSYTVYWCQDKSNLSQCTNINWTVVDSNTNMQNISFLSNGRLFQGVSANSRGLSSGIVWASCTILPGRGGTVMKPPEIQHPGPSYMYLSWKLECFNRNGPLTGFVIEYCLIENCSENSTCYSAEQVTIAQDKRFYNITGLKPYSEYAIFISVKNEVKQELRSKAKCVKTLEGVPDKINSVEITNCTNSSISLKWSPPESINGVLTHYLVHWEGRFSDVGDNTSYTLNDLKSYKEYNISVSACTAIGCGLPSRGLQVTTLMGYPDIPTNIILNFPNQSAIISWSNSTPTESNFTYYNVEFHVFTDKDQKFYEVFNVTGLQKVLPWENCDVDGKADYSLRVRAVNMLDSDSIPFIGEWSEKVGGRCSFITTPSHYTVIIPLVAVLLSLVLCIFCAVFSQHLWVKFNQMRDIGVKLPARLGTRQEDKSENHGIHLWNNHMVRETDNNLYRPSPDQQSLLKVKEEIEMVQEDISNDRDSFGCDIIQNSAVCGNPDSPPIEPDTPPTVAPTPGYILVSPQPSGYVTIPPLSRGYIMATLPPTSNHVSPSLPQCSIVSLKQNGFNSIGPKPCNSFPEPNHLYGDMVSPINST